MRIEYLIISFLLFTAIVLTGTMWVGNLGTNYNMNEDLNSTYFKNSYDTQTKITDIVMQQQNSTLFSGTSNSDATNSIITGSYNALRLVPLTFELTGNMITDIGTQLGIGNIWFWRNMGVLVLTILIVFSIIYILITRYNPP